MLTVILANGQFPTHTVPLTELKSANRIICCDGAVENLEKINLAPTAIVGDLDSISAYHKEKYADRLFQIADQDTNDLTKAVYWCNEKGYNPITILAATGKRDDHTLGNIDLLLKYKMLGLDVKMITDYGIFIPLISGSIIESYEGQQVSIFSFNNRTRITTYNLKYPIQNQTLPEFWMGTLNQSLGSTFEIKFSSGQVSIFLAFK